MRPPLLLTRLCVWFVCLLSAAVAGRLVKVNDSTTITCGPDWDQAKTVRSRWHRGQTTEVTPNSTIYEMLQSGVSVNTRGRPDLIVERDTFTLTIGRVQIEDDAYFLCKVIKKNYKESTYWTKLDVYISPKITWTAPDEPTYTENTAVTLTCTIERVYPALRHSDFQMRWGTHIIQPNVTWTRNADKSYRYMAQYTRTLTKDDDGTEVSCTFNPGTGDQDSLVKTVHVEAVGSPGRSSNIENNKDDKKDSSNNNDIRINGNNSSVSSRATIPGTSLPSISVISALLVIIVLIVLIVLIGIAVYIRKRKSKPEKSSVDGSLPTTMSCSLPTKSSPDWPATSTTAQPIILNPPLPAPIPVALNAGTLIDETVVTPSGMPLVAVNNEPTTELTASPSTEQPAEDGPFIKTNIERVRKQVAESILNDTERNYQMGSNPRGKVILLSIDNFANVRKDRIGSDKDVINLNIMFTELGFQVETWSNLTAQGIRARIKKEQQQSAHQHYDAFVMCVFSHGNKGTIQDCECRDIDVMDQLLKPFNAINAPGLAHKPKMFFIQACQAERRVPVESDSGDGGMESHARAYSIEDNVQQGLDTMALGPTSHEMADFLLVHSALEGYPSYRHTEMGSFFIRDLVSVIRERCHKDHMADMMIEVTNRLNTRVTSSFGQISSTRSTLTRRVYLLPGYST